MNTQETCQVKRGRGRPVTGTAMTPAQKQKAYRERQLAKEKDSVRSYRELAGEEALWRKQAEFLQSHVESLETLQQSVIDENEKLRVQVQQLQQQNEELKQQLINGNVTKNSDGINWKARATELQFNLDVQKASNRDYKIRTETLEKRIADKKRVIVQIERNLKSVTNAYNRSQENIAQLREQLAALQPKKRSVIKNKKLEPDNMPGGYQQTSID